MSLTAAPSPDPAKMDVDTLRRDFSLLDGGAIYMDSAASALTPAPVLAAMHDYYTNYRASVGRGAYRLAQRASEAYAGAHARVAAFLGAAPDEIVLTRNATESLNLVAGGLAWRPGDRVVTTLLEHHSNFLPWQRLRDRRGIDLAIVRPSPEGQFDLAAFEQAIDGARLVAVSHASNVLGSLSPVAEIAALAHAAGALLLVDAAQSAPHLPLDVAALGCDLLACSGHKMLGPTGTGVLYARAAVLEQLEPANLGGGTIRDVDLDGYELADSWMRFEGGTPNIAGGIGLGAAVDYMLAIGMDNVRRHEMALTGQLLAGLAAMPDVEVYGPPDAGARTGLVSFNVGRLPPHRVAAMLDEWAGIMVRSGHHCCHPLMKHLLHRPRGTVRASFSVYNTAAEVEALLAALDDIRHNGGGDWT